MKLRTKVAVALTALALAAVPATVVANPPTDPGNGNGPEYNPAPEKPETPGPHATLPEKAKAYGVYCRGESKKHVAGKKGTPFSDCVNTMAKLATNEQLTPSKACRGESKKHVKGEKGTAFSRCVSAGAKLRKHQHEEEQQA